MTWATIFMATFIGVFAGSIITQIFLSAKRAGTLRIDRSDPDDSPYLFLELEKDCNVEVIAKRKYVKFEVKDESYISQK